jgi:hypothetical protein
MLDMVRAGKKMTILKGVVDSFSYFSLISVILFSNQYHPRYLPVHDFLYASLSSSFI